MFYVLSKILDVLLSPLSWAILLCLAGLPHFQRYRVQRWAPAAAALVLCVFSTEPVANGLARALESPPAATIRADVTYDAVILLGGVLDDRATWTYGQASYNDDVERMLTTYDLLRTGRARAAVISSGPVDATRAEVVESHVVARQLTDWGIAPDRVIAEDKARNTRENAVETERLARANGWTRILVVTSAMHVPRAMDCFRAVKLDVDVLPVDYRSFDAHRFSPNLLPRATELALSTSVIREAFGRLVYRLQGYGAGR